MNFPFYIAKRYLFSKKPANVINLISAISVVGVAIATIALVVTLSVFNGFHDLVATLFTAFDPQLQVVPTEGKTVAADDPILTEIRQLPEMDVVTETVEDQALAVYGNRQAMVKIKGVDDNFAELTHINEILYGNGSFQLRAANLQYGTLGIRLAQTMGMSADWPGFLKIYAPRREGQLDLMNPEEGFVEDSLITPGVVFSVQQSLYDRNYIITSISFARSLFDQQGMVSSLEMRIKPGSDLDDVKAKMKKIAGKKYKVLDRYEQQEDTFRIMKVEKFIAYIFLTFILIVACFNIISSLSMLMIDKKDDVVTLRNLGANDKQITQIFLFEGRMISAIGAVLGILIGLLLCWIQQTYGIVHLGESEGSFIVNAYPVSVHPQDIVVIFFTVLIVGWLAVWYPVRYFSKKIGVRGWQSSPLLGKEGLGVVDDFKA